jgi:hypothetical protein
MNYIIAKNRPVVIPRVDFLPKQKETRSHNSTLALQFKELEATSLNTWVYQGIILL